MGPTWGPPGSCRPQMGPMLAPWTLLSGYYMVPCLLTPNQLSGSNSSHILAMSRFCIFRDLSKAQDHRTHMATSRHWCPREQGPLGPRWPNVQPTGSTLDQCGANEVCCRGRFIYYRPFVRKIHRSSVDYPHKGPVRASMVLLLLAWISSWTNNPVVGRSGPHSANAISRW